MKRHSLLSRSIFGSFTHDLILQQYYGVANRSTYLTGSRGQALFFESMRGRNAGEHVGASAVAKLAHIVPLFSDVPLNTAICLRREEPEAFIRYRAAMNALVKNTLANGSMNDRDVAVLYEDEIRPRILELEAKSKRVFRTGVKRSLQKSVAWLSGAAASIAVGFLSGRLPMDYAAAFALFGGMGAVKEIAESLLSIPGESDEVRNDSLYFLLRLQKKT